MRLVAFILLLLPISSIAQSPLDNWRGSYSGDMIIGNINRPNDTIPVDYTMDVIEPDSIWSYKMTFNSAKYGTIVKDYLIVSKVKGDTTNYLFDEQNGIIMELSYMNNCLYGMYDVMGNMYISTMKRTDYGLFFELFAAPCKSTLNTVSDTEVEEEPIPVESHKPILHQTVRLIKSE